MLDLQTLGSLAKKLSRVTIIIEDEHIRTELRSDQIEVEFSIRHDSGIADEHSEHYRNPLHIDWTMKGTVGAAQLLVDQPP
jgi:hypothetical protein